VPPEVVGVVQQIEINALLASEEFNSEQIENILVKFSEMGINVVETKEARSGCGGSPRRCTWLASETGLEIGEFRNSIGIPSFLPSSSGVGS
jgi:hypothetical protein